eukprot:GHVS01098667.1.p1 GENE.GHVS01098667.1~~GHVS01098667.1.p1  ORF type:complete len:1220 (-),score=326.19 GHVS01098667.1:345-4004(-)
MAAGESSQQHQLSPSSSIGSYSPSCFPPPPVSRRPAPSLSPSSFHQLSSSSCQNSVVLFTNKHTPTTLHDNQQQPWSCHHISRRRIIVVCLFIPIIFMLCFHPLHLPLLISYNELLPLLHPGTTTTSAKSPTTTIRLPLLPNPSYSSLTALLYSYFIYSPSTTTTSSTSNSDYYYYSPIMFPPVLGGGGGDTTKRSSSSSSTAPHGPSIETNSSFNPRFSLIEPFPSFPHCRQPSHNSTATTALRLLLFCPSVAPPTGDGNSKILPTPPPHSAFSPILCFICRICWWLFTSTTEVVTYIMVFIFSFFYFLFISFVNFISVAVCQQSDNKTTQQQHPTTPTGYQQQQPTDYTSSSSSSSVVPLPSSSVLLFTLSLCHSTPPLPSEILLRSPQQLFAFVWKCRMPPLPSSSNIKTTQQSNSHILDEKIRWNEQDGMREDGGWLWKCWCAVRTVLWYVLSLPGISLIYKTFSSFLFLLWNMVSTTFSLFSFSPSSFVFQTIPIFTFWVFRITIVSACLLVLFILCAFLLISEMLYLHLLPYFLWVLFSNACYVLYTAIGRLLCYTASCFVFGRVGGVVGQTSLALVVIGWVVASLGVLLWMEAAGDRDGRHLRTKHHEDENDDSVHGGSGGGGGSHGSCVWKDGGGWFGRGRKCRRRKRRLLLWLAVVIAYILLERQLRHAVLHTQMMQTHTAMSESQGGGHSWGSWLKNNDSGGKGRRREKEEHETLCRVDEVVCDDVHGLFFNNNSTIPIGSSSKGGVRTAAGEGMIGSAEEGAVIGATEAMIYLLYECVLLGGWLPGVVATAAIWILRGKMSDEGRDEHEGEDDKADEEEGDVVEGTKQGTMSNMTKQGSYYWWKKYFLWIWNMVAAVVRRAESNRRTTTTTKGRKSRRTSSGASSKSCLHLTRLYRQLAIAGGDRLEQTKQALEKVWGAGGTSGDVRVSKKGGVKGGGKEAKEQKGAGRTFDVEDDNNTVREAVDDKTEKEEEDGIGGVSFGLVNHRKYLMERELHEATLEQCKLMQDRLLREMRGREEDDLYIQQLKHHNRALEDELEQSRTQAHMTDDKHMSDILLASSTHEGGSSGTDALVSTLQARVQQRNKQLETVRNSFKLLEKQNERLRDEVEDLSVYRASNTGNDNFPYSLPLDPPPTSPLASESSAPSITSLFHHRHHPAVISGPSSPAPHSVHPIAESVSDFLTTLPEKIRSMATPLVPTPDPTTAHT